MNYYAIDMENQPVPIVRKADGARFTLANETVRLVQLQREGVREAFGAIRVFTSSAACTVVPIITEFPLAARMDLPQHEREISAESLRLLREGIAQAKAGMISPVPLSVFEDDEDEE